ncbi:MAG TPA: cysteine synthase family protein [Bacteroidota bacterium]|nr:cysteine synthase family protein [Bacteroidota bacterium]
MVEPIAYRLPGTLLPGVGRTPLLRLAHLVDNPRVRLYAKAEWYNPGGSVKDRPALSMIQDGERTGKLTKSKVLIDATSGNTGIAYAMFGATLGYGVELVVPANIGIEKRRILQAYGANVIYSDPLEGTDGARELARTLVAKNPQRYFYPDQYNNPANWLAHYQTTGQEILEQTRGSLTHFVCGLGTTGTFIGSTRRLKQANEAIRCIAVQPDAPLHGLEGLKHLASAWVPGIFDSSLVDSIEEVATEDAYAMVKRLARDEGLLVGVSSGAAAVAAVRIASGLEEGVIVTIFPDNAFKYLGETFWEK